MAVSQHTFSDCGYACISTLLAHYKHPASIHTIKALVGSTERGLSIGQLHRAFEKVGGNSSAIAFDRHRASAYPCPGVILLKRGHYVALTKRRGNKLKVFNPPLVGKHCTTSIWNWTRSRWALKSKVWPRGFCRLNHPPHLSGRLRAVKPSRG
ncbi:MAG: cysteine peptidase family C39 domain-containing protein [Burkholderiales bacterium]|nr:hypothetical protein [Rhodocyclaceae bacterium]MCA3021382.1 hypothetical protein [Rhodocyclaceae bacterium]MCA3053846.1 hypothetical protein [Rhodocyclaceae bacterium]